ncbi:MAG: hypothetical protein ACOCQD_00760 [archaeon]
MYKKVKTDEVVITDNGVEIKPVATLADEYGGRCQIWIDDSCYVLSLIQDDGRYKATNHIFKEAFDVLVTLKNPIKMNEIRHKQYQKSKCKSTDSKNKKIKYKHWGFESSNPNPYLGICD